MRCSGSSALCIRWICFSPPYGMCMRTRHEGFESACRHAPQGGKCVALFCASPGGDAAEVQRPWKLYFLAW